MRELWETEIVVRVIIITYKWDDDDCDDDRSDNEGGHLLILASKVNIVMMREYSVIVTMIYALLSEDEW